MKLEKFDLEKALNGAKVVTRHGREVLQLTKFESLKDYPLIGVVNGIIRKWTIEGKYMANELGQSSLDLYLAVEPQRKWVNLYKDVKGNFCIGQWCHSLEEAKYLIDPSLNFIKTIEITDEL